MAALHKYRPNRNNNVIMKIDKALEHMAWRLKNSKPTEKDVEAYNSLLDWKRLQEQYTLQKNESLAKLWIEKLILLNETEFYSGERSIQIIDEILSRSLYSWVLELQAKLSIMRFRAVLNKDGDVIPKDINNVGELRKNLSRSMLGREDELNNILKQEVSEENAIKFIEKQINRVVNKFEK